MKDKPTSNITLGSFLLWLIFFVPQSTYGQHFEIRGRVVDEFNKQPLQHAVIKETGASNGATTCPNGCFTLTVSNDTSSVEISYLGFLTTFVDLNHNSDLGDIVLKLNSFEIKGVTITSQVAFERESPIALSAISSRQIEGKNCNKEFPFNTYK